jgi:hypothetical protein
VLGAHGERITLALITVPEDLGGDGQVERDNVWQSNGDDAGSLRGFVGAR